MTLHFVDKMVLVPESEWRKLVGDTGQLEKDVKVKKKDDDIIGRRRNEEINTVGVSKTTSLSPKVSKGDKYKIPWITLTKELK